MHESGLQVSLFHGRARGRGRSRGRCRRQRQRQPTNIRVHATNA